MHDTELIDKLVRELSYRVGIPNVHDREHQSIMSEILTEWGEFDAKETIFNFLNEAPDDDKYSSVGYGYFVRKGDEEKEDAQKYKKDDGGNYVPVSPDQYKKDKQKQGDAGKKAAANTPQNKQGGGEEGGEQEQPETGTALKGKGGKDYTDNLPPNDPAYTGKDKKDNDVDEKSKEKVAVSQEKIGKVEDSGDSQAKNDVLEFGYKGYEKKTGKKPAPGGSGSAFNEIVSGELIHVLKENPNMTEEELAQYCQERFGNTTLGKEQKETAGIPRNPELEKRRKEAIGNGTVKKPQFPKQLKEVEQERATYSKSRVSARSAMAKFERTKNVISNLQSSDKLGKDTKLHTFYGADDSISAQVDMVDKANKVLLPDGTEVDKEDMKEFIKQGGGGMNPSDTGTFVSDENGNLVVQFHSDKTTTGDIQDNSTLAKEEDLYNSYIDKTSLNDDEKEKAKSINKEYAEKMTTIEEEYNNQSKGIAKGLLELDLDKQAKIVDEDTGTLQKNLDIAIFGKTSYTKEDFSSVSKEFQQYLPQGVSPSELTNKQKLEMLYRYSADGGKMTGDRVKPINKVALQYEKENPSVTGLNVKTMLSKQREEVVNLQRERVQSLNDFKSDVDGVSVPMGTLMEAEESVRGFHLTLMDYPPKQYTKGDPSSIVGGTLDVNMGGVVVTGQTLRGCLGVENTTEFKQKFQLKNEEKLTTDDPRGYPYGNVTGKVVHTYMIDVDGNEKEIGFKTYRSKTGAAGKTSNTMSYSKEMQDCFKSKQQ